MTFGEPTRALDASIIVRYLTGDIPHFASVARRIIDSETPLGIPAVALLEVAHVLRRPPYSVSRDALIEAFTILLQRPNIQGIGVDAEIAVSFLSRCRGSSAVSVGDALIAATCHSAGISEIYTFDARFGRSGLHPAQLPLPDNE